MANSLEKTIALLNETTSAAIKAKVTLESLVQQMMKNPSATVQANYADELARVNYLYERYIVLLREANSLMNKKDNIGRPPGFANAPGYVPGGATPGAAPDTLPNITTPVDLLAKVSTQFRASVTKAMEALKNAGYNIAEVVPTVQTSTAFKGIIKARASGADEMSMPGNFKFVGDALGNWGKSLADMRRMKFVNNPVNLPLLDYAGKFGYGPDDYKNTRSEGGGAYKLSRFENVTDEGIKQRHDFRVDKQGGISTAPVGKQFQSFTQGIGKDIGDLLKWSVAISAIYGPINAASEAIKQLVENESKLADVSIALNPEVADTARVFNDVYISAKASGESVSGVIDAFGAAYTAAGRITDGNERYTASIRLLNDSLVLSKLSTLDQAGAIDVLTAALYQTGDANATASEKLSRGTQLIDQWIQVSKIAAVSVETLATGVAVLGDSAETAGLTLEQMNAMIATLSEVSLSSGKETANIAKALIGNYQQESAVKELNRLGISVVDATGKTRQFLDVMKEVAALRSQKLLGDQDFSRLTLALGGGGIRRQKDVAAFIENFGRMEQLAGSQGDAGGSSAEALGKKLDTVQTASTNLSNSFVKLAQTMGTKGGLLDVFSSTLKLGTGVVEIFDKIANAVGKVGPLLLAAGASALLLGRGGLAGATDKLGTNFTIPAAERLGLSTGAGVGAAGILTGQRAMFGSNRMGGINTLPTAAAIALPAIQNLSSGDTTEAGANIAGGIAGALVGGPVGALIGSAIAEAFVRTTMTYDVEFAEFFAGTYKSDKGGKSTEGSVKSVEDLMKEAFKEIGGGSENFGRLRVKNEEFTSNFSQGLGGLKGGGYKTEGAAALAMLDRINPELAAEFRSKFAAAGSVPEGTSTRLTKRQKEITDQPGTSDYLKRMQLEEQDKLRKELITGKIKPSDYSNRLSSTSAFTVTAPRYLAAMEDQVGGVGDAFKSTEEAYKAFLEILSSGNQESISNINAQIATLDQLQNVWDNWDPKAKTTRFTISGIEGDYTKGDLDQAIKTASEGLGVSTKDAAQQARLNGLQTRDVYGSNIAPAPAVDVAKVIADTQKIQDRKYNTLEPADYAALKESWEPFYVLVEEAGKVFYKQVESSTGKIDKALFGEAYQAAQQAGTVSTPGKGLDFTQMDITEPQLRMAEARAAPLTKELEGKGYKSNITDTLVATTDEQISVAHGDMKIIQYVLQQILDTEKKQLQGIWNMPEGASFWVPLQSMISGGSTGHPAGVDIKDPTVTGPNATAKDSMSAISNFGTLKELQMPSVEKAIADEVKKSTIPGPSIAKDDYMEKILGGNPRGATGAEGPSAIEQLIAVLKGMLMPAGSLGPVGLGGGLKEGAGGIKGGKQFGPSQTREQSALQTKMDIRFTSTTNLMVDGRVLASIVKPYLAADLLKTNESGGTVTRSYVI